ncbi:MAG: MNIO family bufferin maturase [Luteimonas sp.]
MTTHLPSSPDAMVPAGAGLLPLQAGAGFKPRHLDDWLTDADAPAFFEIHAENYMGDGGPPHAWLTRLRESRPLSLHGVGLSIGGESPPDPRHLDRLARLIARYRPAAFSEHLAWSTHGGRFYNDLLPLTYDARTLDRVCAHIDRVQSRLRVRMLLENPSTYVEFSASSIDEPTFIAQVIARTGCGLLLDVNNVFVTCHNHARNACDYLAALPLYAVGEIHLAGHAVDTAGDATLLIDSHGAPVADAVWQLYADVLARTGAVATLIEWDNDVPTYARLREEVRHADALLGAAGALPQEMVA